MAVAGTAGFLEKASRIPVQCFVSSRRRPERRLETINASRYGNSASLFTERGREAREFRLHVEAGNVGVNVGTAAPMAFFHFGGQKDSFFGDLHAQAEDVIRFYRNTGESPRL